MISPKHLTAVGWLWSTFGILGFIYACFHILVMGHSIYAFGGPPELLMEIAGCIFTALATMAGFGILRRWHWARIAIHILGSCLLVLTVVALFYSEVVIAQRLALFLPAALVALYSVAVALSVRYETEAAKDCCTHSREAQ